MNRINLLVIEKVLGYYKNIARKNPIGVLEDIGAYYDSYLGLSFNSEDRETSNAILGILNRDYTQIFNQVYTQLNKPEEKA